MLVWSFVVTMIRGGFWIQALSNQITPSICMRICVIHFSCGTVSCIHTICKYIAIYRNHQKSLPMKPAKMILSICLIICHNYCALHLMCIKWHNHPPHLCEWFFLMINIRTMSPSLLGFKTSIDTCILCNFCTMYETRQHWDGHVISNFTVSLFKSLLHWYSI